MGRTGESGDAWRVWAVAVAVAVAVVTGGGLVSGGSRDGWIL